LVYEMKYFPAGFTWEEYLAEPAYVVENMIHIWLEKDKQFKKTLENADGNSSYRGTRR